MKVWILVGTDGEGLCQDLMVWICKKLIDSDRYEIVAASPQAQKDWIPGPRLEVVAGPIIVPTVGLEIREVR